MKPRVLVTTGQSFRNAQLRRVDVLTGRNYSDGLVRTGLLPLMVAPLDPALAGDLLDGVAGVVLSGGADLDPALFGGTPHPELGSVDPQRDAFELALYAAARERGLPILGICRGIQTIAVAEGGTLHQHLPALAGANQHDQKSLDGHPFHRIRIEPDSALADAFGGEEARVNSYHHQAVDRVPPTLATVATSEDGVVEAVEGRSGAFLLGVQWHPEMAFERHPEHLAPFAAFADACRAATAERGAVAGG